MRDASFLRSRSRSARFAAEQIQRLVGPRERSKVEPWMRFLRENAGGTRSQQDALQRNVETFIRLYEAGWKSWASGFPPEVRARVERLGILGEEREVLKLHNELGDRKGETAAMWDLAAVVGAWGQQTRVGNRYIEIQRVEAGFQAVESGMLGNLDALAAERPTRVDAIKRSLEDFEGLIDRTDAENLRLFREFSPVDTIRAILVEGGVVRPTPTPREAFERIIAQHGFVTEAEIGALPPETPLFIRLTPSGERFETTAGAAPAEIEKINRLAGEDLTKDVVRDVFIPADDMPAFLRLAQQAGARVPAAQARLAQFGTSARGRR